MPQRDIDLLMGIAFFLVGALIAILLKAWMVASEPAPAAVFIFGPSDEPERAACEARRRKALEEQPE